MSKYIALLALSGTVNGVSLKDVKHVIMLMQENRSFQHVSCEAHRYILFCKDLPSNYCSISGLWQAFAALPIPTCRSIPTADQFGTSKHGVHPRD